MIKVIKKLIVYCEIGSYDFACGERTRYWYINDKNTIGKNAMLPNVSKTISDIRTVFQFNFYFRSILIVYGISSNILECLSACQNLAWISAKYPCPVYKFSWLNGTYIGIV